ncbi:MAG: hypothetical protein R2764_18180 [Bacteroidales bacterium]
MRNLLLFILLGLFAGVSYAQHHHHESEMYCSKARFVEEYYKNVKDVEQTPYLFDYDVKFYFLDIEVDNSSIYISGEVTVMAEVVSATLDTFALELLDVLTVEEVTYNGNVLSADHTNDEVFIVLPETLVQGDLFSVSVKYQGTPPTGGFFAGVTNSNGWGKDVTWTLSEPFAARSWFPVKQVLEDKADSAWIFLTTAKPTWLDRMVCLLTLSLCLIINYATNGKQIIRLHFIYSPLLYLNTRNAIFMLTLKS